MKNIRIIPRLDIKGPNLVKGIHLEGLRVLGKPEVFAKYYYENGADEIFYQDIVASLYGRNNLKDIITKTAQEIFIPLTVGGGLRTLSDISEVLRAGADKISINTAAVNNPDLIKQASRKFGSSTIVVAIEAIRASSGNYFVFTDNGREETGLEVTEWASRVQDLGAGEVILTSVDREGTGKGFDIELIEKVSKIIEIPLIVHGGAGSLENILECINLGSVEALAISSIFHYDVLSLSSLSIDYSMEGNVHFIENNKKFEIIKPLGIGDLKQFLEISGINHRPVKL